MTSYPRIVIDAAKLKHNYSRMVEIGRTHGVGIFAVTKVYTAMPELARIAVEAGVEALADSRIENLEQLASLGVPRVLLRLPMLSEVDAVVRHAEISLNSEVTTIRALADAAARAGLRHGVVLMVDLGDLREGMKPEEAIEFAGEILDSPHLELKGIGVNLTCYGGVIPSTENLSVLADTAAAIEDKYGVQLAIVSGGNSSSIPLLQSSKMPKRINNLRIGEAVVCGKETAYLKELEGFHNDTFVLEAEIVELKHKPSVPTGEIGYDAFGQVPTFVDRGERLRAIVAIGKQDIDASGLTPLDSAITLVGGSSDHTIFDLTDCSASYRVGDVLRFRCDYGAMLRAFTSRYVKKVIR